MDSIKELFQDGTSELTLNYNGVFVHYVANTYYTTSIPSGTQVFFLYHKVTHKDFLCIITDHSQSLQQTISSPQDTLRDISASQPHISSHRASSLPTHRYRAL